MTRKAPANPSEATPAPAEVHEKETTVTLHLIDIQPVDDYEGDDSSIANALKRKKYNPTLSASELGMDKKSWNNRLRMAYLALFAMIIVNAGLFFITDSNRIDKLGNAFSWFDVACASVIGSFMGFKAFQDIKGRN